MDPGELGGKGHMPGREFIPKGPSGSFDSHVCFAAHMPLKMPDGSSRIYYMGGNGPHSGARNSSFALATLPPDRFAGLKGTGRVAETKMVTVTGSKLLITADVESGGSVTVGVVGHGAASQPITTSVTDGPVHGLELGKLVGKEVQLTLLLKDATVYTIGFSK
eukprot:SAG31_NODE_13669_length_854_cov_1.112583_1_plen_163_part_00